MKTKKSLITAIAVLVVAIIASVACVFAYYAGTQTAKSKPNTIKIGTTTMSVSIGDGAAAEGNPDELYSGDSASFTYEVDITGYKSANITCALKGYSETDKSDAKDVSSDFSVKIVDNADTAEKPTEITSVTDGKTIKVTVTLNERVNAPEYGYVDLEITLTGVAASTGD